MLIISSRSQELLLAVSKGKCLWCSQDVNLLAVRPALAELALVG